MHQVSERGVQRIDTDDIGSPDWRGLGRRWRRRRRLPGGRLRRGGGSRGGRGDRQPGVFHTEGRNFLLYAVFEHLKIGLRETGDVMPFLIGYDHRNQYLLHVHLDGRLRRGRWRSVWRMLKLLVTGLEGGVIRRQL